MSRARLLIILIARTTLNVSYRIIYPFLPAIARGLNISVAAAGSLVTLRMVAGLAAPFLGPAADRFSRRSVMEIALWLFTVASLLLAGIGTLPAAVIAFVVYGLAKILYDPATHAYLGDTIPYRERGRVVGIIELAWSGAWLIGVPASGYLIERFGWRAPWLALVALGALGALLTRAGLPATPPAPATTRRRLVASMLATWWDLLHRPGVAVLLAVSVLATAASEIPLIVYGAWLETAFGLGLTTLGLASIVVGGAEAAAELGTAAFTDRLGKRRSIVIGLIALAISLIALPWLATLGLAGALAGVVLITLGFEFAIVSLLPLATEVVPDARASLLSLNMTAFSLGRIGGAVGGAWLWQGQAGAIALNAGVAAVCALLAALLMARGMAEPG